jgi:hypothetical protein
MQTFEYQTAADKAARQAALDERQLAAYEELYERLGHEAVRGDGIRVHVFRQHEGIVTLVNGLASSYRERDLYFLGDGDVSLGAEAVRSAFLAADAANLAIGKPMPFSDELRLHRDDLTRVGQPIGRPDGRIVQTFFDDGKLRVRVSGLQTNSEIFNCYSPEELAHLGSGDSGLGIDIVRQAYVDAPAKVLKVFYKRLFADELDSPQNGNLVQ